MFLRHSRLSIRAPRAALRLLPAAAAAATALALALVAAGCGGAATPAAARVGDRTIERSDFEDELATLLDNDVLREQAFGADASTDSLPAQVTSGWLENLVYQSIVDAEVEARGLEPTDDDRAAALSIVEGSFGAEALASFSEEFRTTLVERAARVEALRRDLEGPEPTDDDVRAYFDEHRADYEAECPSNTEVSHILVETEGEADAVVAELAGGAEFADLAAQRSTDPGSAPQGGSLGCYTPGTFVPEFEAGVEAAQPGVPTAPVESSFGFHVILVEAPYVTFDNFESRVRADLEAEAGDRLFTLLQERIADLDVEIDRRYGTWVVDDFGARIEPPEAPAPRDGREVPGTGGAAGAGRADPAADAGG
jgi:hypothetical protein